MRERIHFPPMRSSPYEPLVSEGEWDCEDFEKCPFEDMLCHKCPHGRLSELQRQISNTLNEYNIAGSITADQAIDKIFEAYEGSLLESQVQTSSESKEFEG